MIFLPLLDADNINSEREARMSYLPKPGAGMTHAHAGKSIWGYDFRREEILQHLKRQSIVSRETPKLISNRNMRCPVYRGRCHTLLWEKQLWGRRSKGWLNEMKGNTLEIVWANIRCYVYECWQEGESQTIRTTTLQDKTANTTWPNIHTEKFTKARQDSLQDDQACWSKETLQDGQ